MRFSKTVLAGAVAGLALTGLSTTALAAHGKAGQWTVDMTIAGQDTSKMPQQVLDTMRARGMVPNGKGGFTVQRCMTAAEVADDNKMLDTNANKNCQWTFQNVSSHTATAELVCKGQVNGTSHVRVDYDSDTHYSGHMTMQGTGSDGTAMTQDQSFDGHWVSATCATPAH